jgi:VIT1/CCC1 family predicted Fe2+/Mn2+ transporter
MNMPHHPEHHKTHRSGRLRAAVLGANDGIVSTASLIVGVAASGADKAGIILAGTAGLVAGAMSMAAGEYVSVKSQEDTERADLEMEKLALENNREEEEQELAVIYQKRGLDEKLSLEVARQLMQHDALEAHARDEIGITAELSAHPFQAAIWNPSLARSPFNHHHAGHTWSHCRNSWRGTPASRSHSRMLLGNAGHGPYGGNRSPFRHFLLIHHAYFS